jgi:hypothetical protein
MAGSPLKRQRRKELRCIQPRIPMHRWRSFSDKEKIVAIFGMSLDEVLELMSIPETANAPTHAASSSSTFGRPLARTQAGRQLLKANRSWRPSNGIKGRVRLTVSLPS